MSSLGMHPFVARVPCLFGFSHRISVFHLQIPRKDEHLTATQERPRPEHGVGDSLYRFALYRS